jgi:hypothetical protein
MPTAFAKICCVKHDAWAQRIVKAASARVCCTEARVKLTQQRQLSVIPRAPPCPHPMAALAASLGLRPTAAPRALARSSAHRVAASAVRLRVPLAQRAAALAPAPAAAAARISPPGDRMDAAGAAGRRVRCAAATTPAATAGEDITAQVRAPLRIPRHGCAHAALHTLLATR